MRFEMRRVFNVEFIVELGKRVSVAVRISLEFVSYHLLALPHFHIVL